MVSKAVASLDEWLARAEEVLQGQREQSLSPSSAEAWENVKHEWTVSLASFELGLADLLDRLCGRPGRWVLIAEDARRSNRFWQALAFEDGSLIVEAAGNAGPEGTERLSPGAEVQLSLLGWDEPDLPSCPNWRRVEATTSPDIADVTEQAVRTLREVFDIADEDRLLLTMFAVSRRGATPASECVADVAPDLDEAAPRRGFRPTTEDWADYYRQLYPGHANPQSGFQVWKYATTAVDITRGFWVARERARATWEAEHRDDASAWPISHPPVVLWLPAIAKAACLACTWIDPNGDADPSVVGEIARRHSIGHGADLESVRRLRVPISARQGVSDEPLERTWV